jgi:hypothetical protein
VFQIVDFSSIHYLKFTYVHLQFLKFFSRVIPRTPMIKGRGGEGMEGRGGKGGMGWGEPQKTNPGYGPV